MNRNAFRTQLTLDLDRAFAAMLMNNPEKILIQYVREHSWNAAVSRKLTSKDPWPDAIPCIINLSALSKSTGCSRGHLSRAKASLIADRVFVQLGEGVTINKNADEWAETRISRTALDYARSAQSVQHPRGSGGRTVPERAHPPVPESAHQTVPTSAHPPVPERAHGVPERAHPCANPGTPPVSGLAHPPSDAGRFKTHASARTREEDSSSLPELNWNSLSSSPSAPSKPETVGGDGDGGDGDGGERESRNPTQDRKARIKAWVRENFDGHLCPPRQLNALLCGEEPEEWIKAALRLAASEARKEEAIVPFAKGHLARFAANGRVDDGPPEAEKPATAKLTLSEMREKQRAANLAALHKAFPKPGTVSDVQQG